MPDTKVRQRYRSGWCGTAQHERCHGAYAGVPCSCSCHQSAAVPTREERDQERSLPGVTPSPLTPPPVCGECGRPLEVDGAARLAELAALIPPCPSDDP